MTDDKLAVVAKKENADVNEYKSDRLIGTETEIKIEEKIDTKHDGEIKLNEQDATQNPDIKPVSPSEIEPASSISPVDDTSFDHLEVERMDRMDAEEKKSSDNDDNVMQGKEVEDIAVAKEEVKPVVSKNHDDCKNGESVVLSEQLSKGEDVTIDIDEKGSGDPEKVNEMEATENPSQTENVASDEVEGTVLAESETVKHDETPDDDESNDHVNTTNGEAVVQPESTKQEEIEIIEVDESGKDTEVKTEEISEDIVDTEEASPKHDDEEIDVANEKVKDTILPTESHNSSIDDISVLQPVSARKNEKSKEIDVADEEVKGTIEPMENNDSSVDKVTAIQPVSERKNKRGREAITTEDTPKRGRGRPKVSPSSTKSTGTPKGVSSPVKSTISVKTPLFARTPTSARRAAKTTVYQPIDFKHEASKKDKQSIPGKGTKLCDIPSVNKNINKLPPTSGILAAAHRLIYGTKGKKKKPSLKTHLLNFSGFLPNVDAEEMISKNVDEELLVDKMMEKAKKLHIPMLKLLCDLFDIERVSVNGKAPDKDRLMDILVTFLGAPTERDTKAAKKLKLKKRSRQSKSPTPTGRPTDSKSKSPQPRKRARISKKQEVQESEEEMSFVEEEDETEEFNSMGEKLPTDKSLRNWVMSYVKCFNLDKVTTKHAIETASDKFGVNLIEKKARIKELLSEEINNP